MASGAASMIPRSSASSAPASSTTIARISDRSVEAPWSTPAGQRTASPAKTRAVSSPTRTKPPPSMTRNQVLFGFVCGSMTAFRAKASSATLPRASAWTSAACTPWEPAGPSGRRWPKPNRRISTPEAR